MPLNLLQRKNLPLIHPTGRANSPRMLPELLIPGSLVISADLNGLGLGQVNSVVGVHVVVTPYISMSAEDQITVFFDNVPVATHTVLEVDEPVDLWIPYGAFIPGTDQIVAIHYRVVRILGEADDSQPHRYRIKLTRPGGTDHSPEPQHQNLFAPVLPPHIAADGVSQADAQAGFKVTVRPYENVAGYDVIDLRWNGHELPRRLVLPAEVGGNIDIDITAAVIALGGDGTDLPIFYRVYDQVNNESYDDRGLPWSVITPVFVHADPNPLPVPEVPEASGDRLQLDLLGSNDVHVRVYPYPPIYAVADSVVLTWHGQTATGELEHFEQTLPVLTSPGLLIFEVPNAKVRAIGGGHANVFYVLKRGTVVLKSSVLRRIEVVGEAVVIPLTRTEDFQSLPLGQIAVGGQVSTEVLTVTNQSGQVQISTAWAATERVLRFTSGAHFSIELAGAGSQGVVFFLEGPGDSFDSVRFYNLQNELVLTQTQLAVGANSVVMPAGKTFSRMEFTCRSTGDLDSIVLFAPPFNLVHFQQARLGDLQLNVPLDLGAATVTKTSVAGVATITRFINTLPIILTASLSGMVLSFAPKEVARAFTLASYGGSLQGALYFYNATGALILTSAGLESKPGVRHFAMPAGEQVARVEYRATDGNYLGIYYVCFSS